MCRILRTFVFAGQAKAAGLIEARMLTIDAMLPLVLFTLLMLMLSLHGLLASGHFPRKHRAAALRSLLGQR